MDMARATSQPCQPFSNLPDPVRALLLGVDRRLRFASLLRGLGLVALVAPLGALVGMTLDFLWAWPLAIRWGAWSVWLGGLFWLLRGRVLAPLWRGHETLTLAALAEQGEPTLGERLTALVGLVGEGGSRNGSPALIEALAVQTSFHAGLVEPAALVSLDEAKRRFGQGLLVLGAFVGLACASPSLFGGLALRFVAPWSGLERIGRVALEVQPGDWKIATGADFHVLARARPRLRVDAPPKQAWLEWVDIDDRGPGQAGEPTTRRLVMPQVEAGVDVHVNVERDSPGTQTFSLTIPKVPNSLRYRVVTGSTASPWFHVEAVAPPSIAVHARVEPPSYTKRPAYQAADPTRIEVWEGSQITLSLSTDRPVRMLEVAWPSRSSPAVAELAPGRTEASVKVSARESGRFQVSSLDDQGLSSRSETARRVVVQPDKPPLLQVQGPPPMTESNARDTLQLQVRASDDVAVASVELHYQVQRANGSTSPGQADDVGQVSVPFQSLGTMQVQGGVTLRLARLGLKAGDLLTYRIKATDNWPSPGGPHVVWSESGTLAIVDGAESMQARLARAQREELEAKLQALQADTTENREQTEQLRYAADAVARGNGEWDLERRRALDARAIMARSVVDRLQLLARDLASTPSYQPLSPQARDLADREAETSRAALEQAARRSDPAGRLENLRQADAHQALLEQRLEELKARFDRLARRSEEVRQLEELAGREEELARQVAANGKQGAEEPAQEPQALKQAQADQSEIRKALDDLLKQSPSLQEEAREARAREAMLEAERGLAQARAAGEAQQGERSPDAAQQALTRAAQALNQVATAAKNAPLPGDPAPGEPGRPGDLAQTPRSSPPGGENGPGTDTDPGAGPPGGRNLNPGDAPGGPGAVALAELKGRIEAQTGRAWGELPGHLRTKILQMSRGRYRPEYSRLIQLYYQEIANGEPAQP